MDKPPLNIEAWYQYEKGRSDALKDVLELVEDSDRIWINNIEIAESPHEKKWKKIFKDIHNQLKKKITALQSQQEFSDTEIVTSKSGTLKSSPKASPADTTRPKEKK